MTAINLICQGGSAYMLTDAAVTDVSGILLGKRPKVLLLRRARMAICWTGFAPMPNDDARLASNAAGARMAAALRTQGVEPLKADQSAIMRALPGALRAMHLENSAFLEGATAAMTSISVGIALWNDQRGPMVIMGDTEAVGSIPPYSFARMQFYLTVGKDEDARHFVYRSIGRHADLSDSNSFDIKRDGLCLLEEQRKIRGSFSGLDHYSIGGRAVLIRVSSNGIRETILRRWPDKIGKRITPH